MTADIPPDRLSFETSRLRLRPVAGSDAPAFFEIHADPEAMRYWSSPPWTEPEHAASVIASDRAELVAGRSIRFAVVELASDAMIGCCSVHRIDRNQARCEVGYILRRSHWGRGLMREAMDAVVTFAFDVLSLRRLEADIDPRNAPSARMLDRLGFRLEASMRERWFVAGEVSDSAIYGLLRSDPRPRVT
jgi:[ribosomal protein S5]-alanine N-acetyltransferase